jgi:GNAT superfamily N-acetyltransferase
MPDWSPRQLTEEHMEEAARVHRAAFDRALPWLVGLHTADEDRWFYRERVFKTCQVWGVSERAELKGIIAFREDWIDQLYVLPEAHGRGIGGALLRVAKSVFGSLQLWTFQRNDKARRFYQARGFQLISETDGAENEEKEPAALYRWTRG